MKLKTIFALMLVAAIVFGILPAVVIATAPGAAHNKVITTQNQPYVFKAEDFKFTHPATPNHGFYKVMINGFGVTAANNNGTAIPWKGQLQVKNASDNWVALNPNSGQVQFVLVSDIQLGKMRFVPATGERGEPYTAFYFLNGDDNGTPNDPNDDQASGNYIMAINVNAAVNRAPDAVNDAATAATGQDITILVLANDIDPDGNALTITSATQPTNGAVSILGGTTVGIAYRSNSGFTGTDSFTYTISDGNGGTDTATVTVTVGAQLPATNQLEIKRVEINGKTNGKLVLDDENEIEVEVKNNLNLDLDDVEITVTILDVDGDDLDEQEEIDIDSRDEETITFTFDLQDEQLDEDNYIIQVKAEGTDRNNVNYVDTERVTVKVDREKHQVVIRKASLDRTTASCSAQSVNLLVRIENVGENDEDDVEIRAFNENLDLDARRSNIELDDFQGSDNDYQVTIPLDIKDARSGEEVIRVEVLRDGAVDDRKDVTLTVNCDSRSETTDAAAGAGQELIDEIRKGLETRKASGSNTEVSSIRNSNSYMVLLGILAVLAFVAVVLALAVMATRKKK